MDTQSIITYKSSFDAIMHEIIADDGSKVCTRVAGSMRVRTLGEHFAVAISRAKDACKSQSISIDDHFRDVTKTIPMPKGAQKEINDILLTRYACYLIGLYAKP